MAYLPSDLGVCPFVPSYDSSGSYKPKVLKNSFGDGYSQRIPDGLNNSLLNFSATFSNLSEADADTLVTFLLSSGGVKTFNLPMQRNSSIGYIGRKSDILCICNDVKYSHTDGNLYNVTATIEEVPV